VKGRKKYTLKNDFPIQGPGSLKGRQKNPKLLEGKTEKRKKRWKLELGIALKKRKGHGRQNENPVCKIDPTHSERDNTKRVPRGEKGG